MRTSHLLEHIEKLEHFVAIAEAGSFAKAAKELRMTQPSLSHAIKILEEILETELFYRSPTGVELTVAGEKLLDFGRKLGKEAGEVEQNIRIRHDTKLKQLTLGTKEPFAVSYWPEYLGFLKPACPHTDFSLLIKRTNRELLDSLLDFKSDLILAPFSNPHSELLSYPVFQETFSFFMSAKALGQKGSQDIENLPIFTFKNAISSVEKSVGQVLIKEGVPSRLIQDVDSYIVARSLSLSGLGIALLPRSLSLGVSKHPELLEIRHPKVASSKFGKLPICISLHRRHSHNKLFRTLIGQIRNYHATQYS